MNTLFGKGIPFMHKRLSFSAWPRLTKTRKDLLLALGVSIAFLLICSKSSPLYPMNDWSDLHCFYTVGRGILDGMVPYRDLYEQKGPVLYFFFALLSLISDTSMIGAFLAEVTAYTLFLFFSLKTARLLLEENRPVGWLAPILSFAIFSSKAAVHGGSVEFLHLWMMSCSLYLAIRAMKEDRLPSRRHCFVIGVFCSAALFTKYTMCGFYLGLAVFVVFWHLCRREAKRLLSTILFFFLGMLPLSVIVFLYFGVHSSINDFLTAYFYNNLNFYGPQARFSKAFITWSLNETFLCSLPFGILSLLSIPWLIWRWKKHGLLLLAFLFSFGALGAITLLSGFFPYYVMIYVPSAVFGLIALGDVLFSLPEFSTFLSRLPGKRCTALILSAGLLLLTGTVCENTYLLRYKRADLPQYRFAETIRQTENATLLNYGFIDSGFYFASQTLPVSRFFCLLNVRLPDIEEEHRVMISSGETDYLVLRDASLSERFPDVTHYILADECSFFFEDRLHTYRLYQHQRLQSNPTP